MKVKRITSLLGVLMAAVFLSAACKTYEPPAASIQGTIFTNLSEAAALYLNKVPENVSGHVVLDNDKDFSNGTVRDYGVTFATNALASTKGFTYEFDNVPAGSYYVYAIVDAAGDGTMSMTSSDHDAYAFFGNTTSESWNTYIPSTPNIVVGSEGYIVCDFWLGIPANHG